MKESESVTLPDGRKLAYADYGDPGGKPLLYFHGWPSSRYQAAFLDEEASQRGLRILAPDRPGVGGSDRCPGRSFGDWPKDVAAFADRLGLDRFRVIGVSGGGPYALSACAKLGDRIERAAVVCGAPPLANASDRAHMHWAYRTLAGLKTLRRATLPTIISLSRWMVMRGSERAPMSWMLRSVPERDREAIRAGGGWGVITRSFLEAVSSGPDCLLDEGELYLEPWDFELEEIRTRVRFWHGRDDANLPCEVAQKLAARIPKCEGRWIDGEGHYSVAVFYAGEMLDWLKD